MLPASRDQREQREDGRPLPLIIGRGTGHREAAPRGGRAKDDAAPLDVGTRDDDCAVAILRPAALRPDAGG